MLNKKVLLGSLVAGAFLLPMTANAGVVNGACYNCHTMHQTTGAGAARAGGTQLLVGTGCESCHAIVGQSNGNTGRGGAFNAPQVDDTTNPNLAGYFNTGAASTEVQHNVSGSITGMPADAQTSPGGSSANTTCQGCHTVTGGHHGSTPSYRMLFTGGTWTEDSIYGNAQGNASTGQAWSTGTTYDATLMNNLCANCHGTFHTTQGSLAAGWIRHPTDVSLTIMDGLTAASYSYVANYTGVATAARYLPLGSAGTTADNVMCITCHFSHGGPEFNLLRFTGYGAGGSNNVAQSSSPSRGFGCETCHSYSGNGM